MPRTIVAPPLETMLAAARRGSPEALAALYDAHAAVLLRTAYHVTGSVHDAEDVVQDLFVALPEALMRYEERGLLGAWLGRLCARIALQRLRATRRLAEDDISDDAIAAPGGLAPEERLTLEEAIASLPEPLRLVFVLREIEGHTHAEIAALLGIRRGTSEVRHHRAIRHLRASMEARS